MAKTLFQYPGGKGRHAKRIMNNMPSHHCYVEPFCGSADILLNKPRSEVEIINDLDEEIIHFFAVYQNAATEMKEWLEGMPYSRKQYLDYVERFYSEDPPGELLGSYDAKPEDIEQEHIVRASVFYYLRYAQWGAKYQGKSGFGASKIQNQAVTWKRAVENLPDFVDRLREVTLECKSYDEVSDIYDGEETFHYFDPPYIGTEGYYRKSDFDHQQFVEFLDTLEGMWMVSYDELPEGLDEYYISVEDSKAFIDSGYKGEGSEMEEFLVTNYDPSNTPRFISSQQTSMESILQGQIQQQSKAATDGGDAEDFLSSIDEEDSSGDGFLTGYDV